MHHHRLNINATINCIILSYLLFQTFPQSIQKDSQGSRAVTASRGSFPLAEYESWIGKEALQQSWSTQDLGSGLTDLMYNS